MVNLVCVSDSEPSQGTTRHMTKMSSIAMWYMTPKNADRIERARRKSKSRLSEDEAVANHLLRLADRLKIDK